MIRRPPRPPLFPYPPLFRSPPAGPPAASATRAGTGTRRRAHRPPPARPRHGPGGTPGCRRDRKSTRLNSSHLVISYAVFCLKKKKKTNNKYTVNTYLHVHTL